MIRLTACLILIATGNLTMAESMTASDINQAWIRGASATDIVDKSLDLIEAEDDNYHAVIVAGGNEVTKAAERLDAMAAADRTAFSLGAVPILIKDNIETREWPTTAGSLALAENRTGRDAPLVSQLRDAGAIILGKANLSEWANFRSESSISGWSGVGGQARNAHDPARSPCGSSSGSAAAVALGYVPVAIGSETDGSIICPASINGVVGLKPTHGLVSGEGIVPLAASQDTAGPIAISVKDAARTLAVIINPQHEAHERLSSALNNINPDAGLEGMRIGVLANSQGFDARRDALLDDAISTLKDLGAEIVTDLRLTPYDGFNQDEYEVLLYEFRLQLNHYLAGLNTDAGELNLDKLIRFNEQSDVELSLFDQSIFIRARDLELTEDAYGEKLNAIKKATREDGLDRLLDGEQLDVLIGTTVGPGWTIDDINGDAFHGPSISSFPAVGGHPHLTVPMGKIRHMPVGLSIIGRRLDDARVAEVGARFEQARPR